MIPKSKLSSETQSNIAVSPDKVIIIIILKKNPYTIPTHMDNNCFHSQKDAWRHERGQTRARRYNRANTKCFSVRCKGEQCFIPLHMDIFISPALPVEKTSLSTELWNVIKKNQLILLMWVYFWDTPLSCAPLFHQSHLVLITMAL